MKNMQMNNINIINEYKEEINQLKNRVMIRNQTKDVKVEQIMNIIEELHDYVNNGNKQIPKNNKKEVISAKNKYKEVQEPKKTDKKDTELKFQKPAPVNNVQNIATQ